jgi:hypothetical protein
VPAIRNLPNTPTGPWAASAPKWPQGVLLKRVLSHFAYGESPAVRTRIRCASLDRHG